MKFSFNIFILISWLHAILYRTNPLIYIIRSSTFVSCMRVLWVSCISKFVNYCLIFSFYAWNLRINLIIFDFPFKFWKGNILSKISLTFCDLISSNISYFWTLLLSIWLKLVRPTLLVNVNKPNIFLSSSLLIIKLSLWSTILFNAYINICYIFIRF